MSIITPAIFKGEITIAQTENPYMVTNVQDFIDEYDPKFLKELLGLALYNEFIAGLAVTPVEDIDAKWIALRDEFDLQKMIAYYVYYWYKRDETTQSGGISENKPKSQNASPTNSVDKQVNAWNKMVDLTRLFDLDTNVYPDFSRVYWRRFDLRYCNFNNVSDIYYPINSLNL